MTKVQLTLTNQEANLLSLRAAQFGYGLTRYLKHLISQEAISTLDEEKVPTFTMSKKAEKKGIQALKSHKAGKSILMKSADDLDSL